MMKTMLAAIAALSTAAYAVNQEEYQFADFGITNTSGSTFVDSHTVDGFDGSLGVYFGIKFYVDDSDASDDGLFGTVTLEAVDSPVNPYSALPHMYCGFDVDGYDPVDVVYDYSNPITEWDGVQTTAPLVPGVPQILEWFSDPRIIESVVFIGGTDIGADGADFDFDFILTPLMAVGGSSNGHVSVAVENLGFSGNVRMNYVYFPADQDDNGSVGFSDLTYVLSHWGEYNGHDNEVLLSVLAGM